MSGDARPAGLLWLPSEQVRRWVLCAIALTAAGYVGVFWANLVLNPDRTVPLVSQGLMVAACAVAFVVAARGGLRAAVGITIFATWLELHSSIPFNGVEPSGPPVSVEFRRGDDDPAWVEITGVALEPGLGRPVRRLTLRDVTERRRAEEGERLLREQFEHSRRLEAVGRLAGGVAHDLNNLFTVVGVSAEMLRAESPVESEAAALAHDVLRAQERGSELVRHLLAFAGKEVIRPTRLAPDELLSELRPILAHLLPPEVRLEVVEPPRETVLHADPGQLHQLLLNLVTNARDALESGGTVTVGVASPGETRAWLGHELSPVPRGMVELWVGDDGAGMDEETRTRMFEPFFTTRPPGRASGLGLPVVEGIATQNGGSVRVASWVGEGTVVRVFWPQVEEAPPADGEGREGAE